MTIKKNTATYIVGPWYDYLFFLFTPIFALFFAKTAPSWAYQNYSIGSLAIPGWIIVYFFLESMGDVGYLRAYLNPTIFKRFRFKLTVPPGLLFLSMYISDWVVYAVIAAEVFIDIYHSSMQTFGISKFYDVKHGNNPALGRKQDMRLNWVIYAAPIFATIGLSEHSQVFGIFENTLTPYIAKIPYWLKDNLPYISSAVIVISAYVIFDYYTTFKKLIDEKKYSLCYTKMILLATTAICCVYVWSFYNFVIAILAVNVFHSLQYFALVWWSEKKSLSQVLRVETWKYRKLIIFLFFCSCAIIFGFYETLVEEMNDMDNYKSLLKGGSGALIRFWLVTNLLHYWHDSFIWGKTKD